MNYRPFYTNFDLVFFSPSSTFNKMFKFFIWSVSYQIKAYDLQIKYPRRRIFCKFIIFWIIDHFIQILTLFFSALTEIIIIYPRPSPLLGVPQTWNTCTYAFISHKHPQKQTPSKRLIKTYTQRSPVSKHFRKHPLTSLVRIKTSPSLGVIS